jgi:hypothetical protein
MKLILLSLIMTINYSKRQNIFLSVVKTIGENIFVLTNAKLMLLYVKARSVSV